MNFNILSLLRKNETINPDTVDSFLAFDPVAEAEAIAPTEEAIPAIALELSKQHNLLKQLLMQGQDTYFNMSCTYLKTLLEQHKFTLLASADIPNSDSVFDKNNNA